MILCTEIAKFIIALNWGTINVKEQNVKDEYLGPGFTLISPQSKRKLGRQRDKMYSYFCHSG